VAKVALGAGRGEAVLGAYEIGTIPGGQLAPSLTTVLVVNPANSWIGYSWRKNIIDF